MQRFAANGISLGYWWGHSASIPVPNQWNPDNLETATFMSNPQHAALLSNEVSLAVERHADEIGLDAFGGPVYERYHWIDRMKQIAPNANFISEQAGPDLIHSKIANFYNDWPDAQTLSGPAVLNRYLNPGSENWAWRQHPSGYLFEYAQRVTRWGYTFVGWIDVTGLDYHKPTCMDGLDNDHNGYADWPYDARCVNPDDDSEPQGAPPFPPGRTPKIVAQKIYPNPALRSDPVTVSLRLNTASAQMSGAVYAMSGEKIAALTFDPLEPKGDGWSSQAVWRHDRVPSGVYIVVAQARTPEGTAYSRQRLAIVK
jgi:hypothetical protein